MHVVDTDVYRAQLVHSDWPDDVRIIEVDSRTLENMLLIRICWQSGMITQRIVATPYEYQHPNFDPSRWLRLTIEEIIQEDINKMHTSTNGIVPKEPYLQLPANTQLTFNKNGGLSFDAIDPRKEAFIRSYNLNTMDEILAEMNNLRALIEKSPKAAALHTKVNEALVRIRELEIDDSENLHKLRSEFNALQDEFQKLNRELVAAQFRGNEVVDMLFGEVDKSCLTDLRYNPNNLLDREGVRGVLGVLVKRINAVELSLSRRITVNTGNIGTCLSRIDDLSDLIAPLEDQIDAAARDMFAARRAADMALERLEALENPVESGKFTAPSVKPTDGDVLIYNGSAWVCGTPKVAEPPPPKVSTLPRAILGAVLFGPALVAAPAGVLLSRLVVQATVPSVAHRIPGFRAIVKKTAHFVFKKDMSLQHLLALAPNAAATFAALEATGLTNFLTWL